MLVLPLVPVTPAIFIFSEGRPYIMLAALAIDALADLTMIKLLLPFTFSGIFSHITADAPFSKAFSINL